MRLQRRIRIAYPPAVRVPPAQLSACGAPNATLYFAPDGKVRACCVNTTFTLGDITQQSIREIWLGSRISELRSALAEHDFRLGCRDCELRIESGDRAWSTAAQYDVYSRSVPDAYPKRMDFILSIDCNLQCEMCNGDLSSSIRRHREGRPPLRSPYGDAFFEELREFLPHLERSLFLGGEPFVAREPQRVWDLMIEQGHVAPVQVVTNGTRWTPRVERYLRELNMSIAMSIDGYTAETLESLRVGARRDEVFANLERYQRVVESHGGTASIHFCLMRQNVHEFGAMCLEAERRGIGVIVMTVTGPDGFGLWDLPPSRLREVLVALEREEGQVLPHLSRNRQVWLDEVDRLRRHLASVEDGALPGWVPTASVSVPMSEPSFPPDDAVRSTSVADAEAALEAWSGRTPLIVRAHGELIVSVDGDAWAEPLLALPFVGTPIADLTALLVRSLGDPSVTEVEDRGEGLFVAELVFGQAPRSIVVRAVASVGHARPGAVRVALATDAPEPLLREVIR